MKPTLVALACALMLAFTNQSTKKTIQSNQRHYEERLIRTMVNGAVIEKTDLGYNVFREERKIGKIEELRTNQGYNGKIELLVALTNDRSIISTRVIYHKETPGIGDKIDSNISEWINQFAGKTALNTRWNLAPDGDIDGISGATITSEAITRVLSEAVLK